MIATSLGGSSGFPFRFEHRLPVSTATLVGVPMATLAALHASLFVIPVLLSQLIYGIPLPVLAGGAIITTMAVLLVAASWSTATVSMRSMALVFAAVGGSTLMRAMQPFHIDESEGVGTQEFAPDFIALSGSQYLWLALVLSGLYAITVYCVVCSGRANDGGCCRSGAREANANGRLSTKCLLTTPAPCCACRRA